MTTVRRGVVLFALLFVASACTGDTEPQAGPSEQPATSSPEPSPSEVANEPSPSEEPDCLAPRGIRRMLLARENPSIRAFHFSAAEAEAQGICCGSGFTIETFNQFGEAVVYVPLRSFGQYMAIEPGAPLEDVTFAPAQWRRFSVHEAHRCREGD